MAMQDKEENASWERMWSARHVRAPPKWLHFMSPQLEWSHFSHPPCTALLVRSLLLLWHLAFGSWCFVLGYCFWAKVHGAASSFLDADLNNQFPKMFKMMALKITSRHTAHCCEIILLALIKDDCNGKSHNNKEKRLGFVWTTSTSTVLFPSGPWVVESAKLPQILTNLVRFKSAKR